MITPTPHNLPPSIVFTDSVVGCGHFGNNGLSASNIPGSKRAGYRLTNRFRATRPEAVCQPRELRSVRQHSSLASSTSNPMKARAHEGITRDLTPPPPRLDRLGYNIHAQPIGQRRDHSHSCDSLPYDVMGMFFGD